MGRRKKEEIEDAENKVDESKPCRCGTGYYCHRHLRYQTSDLLTPALKKMSKGKNKKPRPKYNPSNGGEH